MPNAPASRSSSSIAQSLPIAFAVLKRLRASASSLRGRVILAAGLLALCVLGALGWLGSRAITSFLADQADIRLEDAARRSGILVESLLIERERAVTMLGASPQLVDAARGGRLVAEVLGLDTLSIDVLERRYSTARSLEVDARARNFLRAMLPQLGMAEVMVTEARGLNAITSARTSDFVQRDEDWWTLAMRDGIAPLSVEYDESVRQVVISLASAVRERPGDPPVGVVKAAFTLARIDSALRSTSSVGGIQVDLIDESGRVIASSGRVSRLQVLPGADQLLSAPRDSIVGYDVPAADGGQARRRAALDELQGGRWRLVAHLDERITLAQRKQALGVLLSVTAGLFLLITATLGFLARSLTNRVSRPAEVLALAAEAVAAGDLSIELAPSGNEDEIGRLTRATRSMLADLRRLAGSMGEASRQTSSMAAEITTGSEHMAAAAEEMAAMSSDLSQQSSEMAETIRHLADDANELVSIAAEQETGAEEGIIRNARLRAMATENRERLDESARALEALATDARSTVEATEALSTASEEIRAFVVLVQKIARQSKLLALNAAMEAARAGDEGQGFAVVAGEVRRLSAAAAEGAERTELVVAQLLKHVGETHASSSRAAETVQSVLAATQQGHASFGHVEQAVGDAEGWTATIADASHRTSDRVRHMTGRIEQLAKGTETFVAAMQEVAASSQEQSASTQQIAAAADRLTAAAEKLNEIVKTFRLVPAGSGSDRTSIHEESGTEKIEVVSAQPSILGVLPTPSLITES